METQCAIMSPGNLFCNIIFLFSAANICYVYSKQLHTLINNWWRNGNIC